MQRASRGKSPDEGCAPLTRMALRERPANIRARVPEPKSVPFQAGMARMIESVLQ